MQSTLTPQQTDPHDIFVIEPDVVLAARADHASPDPVQDALTRLAHQRANTTSEVSAGTPSPTVDTTFRAAAAVGATKAPGERSAIGRLAKNTFIAFLFALCSAVVATTWAHHGDAAKQMIANWLPPFLPALSSTATPSPAEQPDASPTQAAAADQAPAQPAQPSEAAAPAPAASSAESTPTVQSMARDLATMGQQIEQLKANIEQLKAGQAQMSRDLAKTSDPNLRPRIAAAALPPRPVVTPVRKPKPVFPATAASTLPPPPSAAPLAPPPPALSQPLQQPQTSFQPDGEPVVRPPLPLH
jgi:hypothetical protein